MRFQQLKSDPNNIVKKRLVKSKKGWTILSSLSIAGGLFFLTGSSTTVKADSATASVKTTISENKTTKSSTKAITTATPTVKQVPTVTVQPTKKITTTTTDTATKTSKIDPTTPTTNTVKKPTISKTPITSPAKTEVSTTLTGNRTTATVPTVPAKTNQITTTDKTVMTATQPTKSDKVDISGPTDPALPITTPLIKTNIAEGKQGTSHWYITSDKTLHIGAGTLDDSKSVTTSTIDYSKPGFPALINTTPNNIPPKVIDDANIDTEDPTTINKLSPNAVHSTSTWINHAKDITSMSVDGLVSASKNMQYVFADLSKLTTITNISNLDTSKTENMEGLFMNDKVLKTVVTNEDPVPDLVDLSSLNVGQVVNMKNMFMNDHAIKAVEFNQTPSKTINQVKDFSYMYKNDYALTFNDNADNDNPYFKNWQLNNAQDLRGMFQNDTSLKKLNLFGMLQGGANAALSTGDSSKNEGMFDGTDLQSLTLGTLNTSLRFSSTTALPSSTSNSWINSRNESFLAMPDNNQTNAGGIGSVFVQGGGVPTPEHNFSVTYTPNSNYDPIHNATHLTFKIPANITIPTNGTVDVPDSPIGSTVSISVPQVKGYLPDRTNINAFVVGDGDMTSDDKVIYTGNPVQQWSVKVTTPNQTTQIMTGTTNKDGQPLRIGDSFTINPTVDGYKVTPGTDTISADTEGNPIITITDTPKYSAVQADSSTATFTASKNHTSSVIIPAGNFANTTTKINVPQIPGYLLSPDSPTELPVIYTDQGKSSVDTSKVTYVLIHIAQSTTTIKVSNDNNVNVIIPEGDYGDLHNLAIIPTIPGYTSNESSLPVTYDKNGKSHVATSNVIYTPINFKASTKTFTDANNNQVTIHIPDVNYGDQGKFAQIQPIPGFQLTADSSTQLPIKYVDGKIVVDSTKIKFVPIQIAASTTKVKDFNNHDVIITIPAGFFGDSKEKAQIPEIPGYQLAPNSPKELPVHYTADGAAIVDASKVNYVPIQISASTTTILGPDNKPVIINIPGSQFGDKTQVAIIPQFPGYKTKTDHLSVNYLTTGKSWINTDNLHYIPIHLSATQVIAKDFNNQDVIIPIPDVDYGKKDQFVNVTKVPGYKSNITKLPIQYTTDGKATIDYQSIKYTPIHIDKTSTTINYAQNKHLTIDIPGGNFGDKNNIALINPVYGYTNNVSQLSVIYKTDGMAQIDTSKLQFTPIHTVAKAITISSPDGNKTKDATLIIPGINFGENETVKVPTFAGYTPQTPNLPIQFDKDGKAFVDLTKIKYFGKQIATGTTIINTPNGPQTIKVPSGRVGDTVTIQVPNIPNYTHVLQTITGKLDGQGHFVSDTKVIYNKISRHAEKITVQDNSIEKHNYLIATYADQPAVQVYYLNHGRTMITLDKTLNSGTDWFSDQEITIANEKYYQINATQWIKANQIYRYEAVKQNISIKAISSLYTAEGKLVTDHQLSADTVWFTDQIIYINGIKYYRVSTNEFVKASDVSEF
ncbi:SLAP domain-containing protein [Companilactobacillus kimchiensis]|uniref:SLAP domain-containing protein n=1 Tax=Companilactobacillus kimchiensis TaxID=993692 RepID=UPI00070AB838|nr:BspA family leucine-rich repeat surface protein [Companilactobacillus kimchiensis]